MGLRETLNKNPTITTYATGGIVVLALIIIGWQLFGPTSGGPKVAAPGTAQAFFTVDDGKTWFKDEASKIPPFDHEGKPAYKAVVVTCDGGKTQFVAYLQRYTPDRKKFMEKNPPGPGTSQVSAVDTGVEIKPPGTGDKSWITGGDPRFGPLLFARCPGSANRPDPVFP